MSRIFQRKHIIPTQKKNICQYIGDCLRNHRLHRKMGSLLKRLQTSLSSVRRSSSEECVFSRICSILQNITKILPNCVSSSGKTTDTGVLSLLTTMMSTSQNKIKPSTMERQCPEESQRLYTVEKKSVCGTNTLFDSNRWDFSDKIWYPPSKPGLENSKHIIPEYYMTNKDKIPKVDYLFMIMDDIKNMRKLNKLQLKFISNLPDNEKNQVIHELNKAVDHLIDFIKETQSIPPSNVASRANSPFQGVICSPQS